MRNLLIIFWFTISASAVASENTKYDCSFIDRSKTEINNEPSIKANNDIVKDNIHFLAAGVGIASFVAGIGDIEESTCIFNKYKIKVIWGGGDIMACKGQYELGKKIVSYVSKYNVALREALKAKGLYKCIM